MEIVFKMQKMSRDAQNVLQRGTLIQIQKSALPKWTLYVWPQVIYATILADWLRMCWVVVVERTD